MKRQWELYLRFREYLNEQKGIAALRQLLEERHDLIEKVMP